MKIIFREDINFIDRLDIPKEHNVSLEDMNISYSTESKIAITFNLNKFQFILALKDKPGKKFLHILNFKEPKEIKNRIYNKRIELDKFEIEFVDMKNISNNETIAIEYSNIHAEEKQVQLFYSIVKDIIVDFNYFKFIMTEHEMNKLFISQISKQMLQASIE